MTRSTGPDLPPDIHALVRDAGRLDPPEVAPLGPEVRSGITFLFRDPQRRGVPAEEQEQVRHAVGQGTLIGPFVTEWCYDVAFEDAEDFRLWLLANERDLASLTPDGVHYRGTYAVAFGYELAGRYRTVWAFDSFAAMQNLGQALARQDAWFGRLVTELNAFRDRSATETQFVYTPAVTAHTASRQPRWPVVSASPSSDVSVPPCG